MLHHIIRTNKQTNKQTNSSKTKISHIPQTNNKRMWLSSHNQILISSQWEQSKQKSINYIFFALNIDIPHSITSHITWLTSFLLYYSMEIHWTSEHRLELNDACLYHALPSVDPDNKILFNIQHRYSYAWTFLIECVDIWRIATTTQLKNRNREMYPVSAVTHNPSSSVPTLYT